MSAQFDPLNVTGPLQLLGRKRAVAVVEAGNGFIVWHYDPLNRVHTPGIHVYQTPGEAIHAMSQCLLDKALVCDELAEAFGLANQMLREAIEKKQKQA